MSREETAERLKSKFLDKGLKDEAVIVMMALSADLPEDKVEKYMTTDLSADQLVEMMVAIMDGLHENTLTVMASGKMEPAMMRSIRIQSRGDAMFQTLCDEVNDVKELAEEIKVSGVDRDKLNKSIRELKSEIGSVRGCVENIEERLKGAAVGNTVTAKGEQTASSKGEAEAAGSKTVKTAKGKQTSEAAPDLIPEQVKNDPEAMKARLSSYKSLLSFPGKMETDEAAGSEARPMDYVTKDGVIISRSPMPEPNRRGILSIFRRINEDRVGVAHDESEKRKAINRIVALGLEEDKLKALSVGARAGVDPETLKKFAERGASAAQIYNYINIFGALFIEEFTPVTASD